MATDNTTPKKQKDKPPKPKYNMWQSSWYMLKLAFREKEKKVPVLCTLTALLAVASNLTSLSITPVILGAVENHAPLSTLLLLIGGFVALTMLLSAAADYVNTNILYGKVTVRGAIITELNTKMATTSYPNISDEKFLKMRGKASDSISCNSAASEAVWDTLTRLLENVLGFLIYLALLSSVNPLLILVILVTSLLGYFINKPLSEYGYRHRDE